ncbi:bactofilin family protein [Paenibacillus dakarensis]|uniref:bactofilin family protein n=1 Tax=Paenibacillus dakarensis TaxID=1527293 RepID=UPI0006D5B2CA|nr:polymer-forming cytoskeletal protein [Paenibacillus dakarensis]
MKKSKRKKYSSAVTNTLISQGSQIEGTLNCDSDLRIDGKFNGSIESQGHVTIGENAIARSNISAKEVIVAGKVFGDIAAEGKLTITPTGQMHGDVIASSLIIMEGGVLNGASHMDSSAADKTGKAPLETVSIHRSEAG